MRRYINTVFSVGQAEMVFKSCAPDNKKPCQVVLPEEDDGTNWKCETCKKDACNSGNALMAFSLPLGLFFSLALLIA
jgi:hypothetical protein